ncbi:type II toxin-antitoxin system RelB/DinJ family antitoxin [Lactobacillus corticis]|uniref:DNA-damage-inducible protein n=1 Tax=Lactobacillus corticis TaxID=2201249 RepID=A0A916VJ84_9LACO|nr:type II toxin-antitoxin system RelB/DinJ family antitoxin [Lactobacillus corticis]GFZ27374.1 DNA-damage-inducible protein [Lactobacillus corticis]
MTTATKKTASVFTRVTPELKNQAEDVLDKLQIPMSTALSMFLQQVVEQQGIPFELKLHRKPLDASKLSKEQFDQKIQKGFDDFKNGDTYTVDQVRQALRDRNR